MSILDNTYVDENKNVYRVELATNGRFIATRTNEGGHRKIFKQVNPCKKVDGANKQLAKIAQDSGWCKASDMTGGAE